MLLALQYRPSTFVILIVYVTLIFHKGAIINDSAGLLEGETKLTRTARFYDMEDVKAKKKNLEEVVEKWVKTMDKI